MKLEDTIKYRLFRPITQKYFQTSNGYEFIIECKAESGKPIPLCMPSETLANADLAYNKLSLSSYAFYEKSTPRAMYNFILNTSYFPSRFSLLKLKLKDSIYYAAPGVLFNSDKYPLFWFASENDGYMVSPKLYITLPLLRDATVSGKPMEKFFMSTIVPYLIIHKIRSVAGSIMHVDIEINKHPEDVFFVPDGSLISSTPVEEINDVLNDILATDADLISRFIENY